MDCIPWTESIQEQILKNHKVWEGPMLTQSVKDFILQEGSHTGGENCEEEGPAETTLWTEHSLIKFHSSCCRGKKAEK